MIIFRPAPTVDDHNAYLTPNTTSSYLPMKRDTHQANIDIPILDSQYTCDDKNNLSEHCDSEDQKNLFAEKKGEVVQIRTFPTLVRRN